MYVYVNSYIYVRMYAYHVTAVDTFIKMVH